MFHTLDELNGFGNKRRKKRMLRKTLNKTQKNKYLSFGIELILVHFPVDDTLSIIKRNSLVPTEGTLEKGMSCQVKERSKVYETKIIEISKSQDSFTTTGFGYSSACCISRS